MKRILLVWAVLLSTVECYEYNLVVSAIFKDEAPYFKEWIEYHKMMGVEHFRLYNNDSTDDWEGVLASYIMRGEVEVVDWPSDKETEKDWCFLVQWPQCQDAIRYFIGKSKWVALIDVDEYLLPLEQPDMTTFLKDYEEYPAVMLNWQCFGTSHLPCIPKDRLMIEALTLKSFEYSVRNFPVKSIVRPECVDLGTRAWSPHTYRYVSKMPPVFPDKTIRGEGFPELLNDKEILDRIRPVKAVVNHYVHRDEGYFWGVKLKKKDRMEKGVVNESYVARWRKDCNKIEDTRIFQFVPELRRRMFRRLHQEREEIEAICERYSRPFTVLSIGVPIEELARKYPKSVFVIFSEESFSGENIIVLRHKPSLEEWTRLASCEHFDITLVSKENEEILPKVRPMSHVVWIEGGECIENKGPFYLERTTYVHPRKLQRVYEVVFDYHQKVLKKIRMGKQEESTWLPGINMMTYILFDGIVPSRLDIVQNVPMDYHHRDFVPNNMILQGKRIVLIDGEDPLSAKIADDDGTQVLRLKGLLDRFLLRTKGLNPAQVKDAFISIYQWGDYFEQEEIDE